MNGLGVACERVEVWYIQLLNKRKQSSVVKQLESHTVVNFVVRERDVVFVDDVPFLQFEFLWSCSCLCCDKFLEVADGIILVTLHMDLLSQTVVDDDFKHTPNTRTYKYQIEHQNNHYRPLQGIKVAGQVYGVKGSGSLEQSQTNK